VRSHFQNNLAKNYTTGQKISAITLSGEDETLKWRWSPFTNS